MESVLELVKRYRSLPDDYLAFLRSIEVDVTVGGFTFFVRPRIVSEWLVGSFQHTSLGYFLAFAEEQSGVIHGYSVREAPYRLVRTSRANGMVYGNDERANFTALVAFAHENQPTDIEVMSGEEVDDHLHRHIQWQIWGILILIAITVLLMVGFTMGGMEW